MGILANDLEVGSKNCSPVTIDARGITAAQGLLCDRPQTVAHGDGDAPLMAVAEVARCPGRVKRLSEAQLSPPSISCSLEERLVDACRPVPVNRRMS